MKLDYPRNTGLYKIAGTKTFRRGCSKILKLWGTNMQNPDEEIRKLYWADKGYVLLERDQSGAEALVVSYLTRHGKFRDLFLNNIKPHVYIGLAFPETWIDKFPYVEQLAALQVQDLKQHPGWKAFEDAVKASDHNPPSTRSYYHYKQTCHSSNYDISENTFRLNILDKSGGKVALTIQQAKKFLSGYHGMFPEIREWHADVRKLVDETRTIYNLFGYPREFNGIITHSVYKEAYAQCAQSTVATITSIACTKTQRYIRQEKRDWHLLNEKHDSLMIELPEKDLEEGLAVTKEYLEQDLQNFRGEKFKMRSEALVGYNWGHYDKERNPNGLREFRN